MESGLEAIRAFICALDAYVKNDNAHNQFLDRYSTRQPGMFAVVHNDETLHPHIIAQSFTKIKFPITNSQYERGKLMNRKVGIMFFVVLLSGSVRVQAQTKVADPAQLLGNQIASALGIVANQEPLPSEFTSLLRTPAEVAAKDRDAMIASLAKRLNAGLSPQLIVRTLQADVHVPQKLHQLDSNDLTWDIAQLAKEMTKRSLALASSNPADAAQFARAALLLDCDDDTGNVGFLGAVHMGLLDSSFPKRAQLDDTQEKQIQAILTPLWHQSDVYLKVQMKLLETELGPTSEAMGAAISDQNAAAIMDGLAQSSATIGEVTMNKYDFACMCANVMRLAKIRKNGQFEASLKAFVDQTIASTKDETYQRWLRESEQVEAGETGALLGHSILIKRPDGTVVPGTRTANGDVVEVK